MDKEPSPKNLNAVPLYPSGVKSELLILYEFPVTKSRTVVPFPSENGNAKIL